MKHSLLTLIQRSALAGIVFAVSVLVTGLVASELVNGLWNFKANDVLSASEINHNFETLNARLTALGAVPVSAPVPVGTITAWHKSFTGTPGLATGWAECNGQVVSDAASPFNGQTLPNLNSAPNAWNSAGSFLRGGTTSGTFEVDTFQGHYHAMSKATDIFERYLTIGSGANGLAIGPEWSNRLASSATGYSIQNPTTGTNNAPRFGNETRPVNMSVVWIIKVK